MLTISEEGLRAAMLDGWVQRDEEELLAVEAEIELLLRRVRDLARRGQRLSVQIAASRAALGSLAP